MKNQKEALEEKILELYGNVCSNTADMFDLLSLKTTDKYEDSITMFSAKKQAVQISEDILKIMNLLTRHRNSVDITESQLKVNCEEKTLQYLKEKYGFGKR